MTDDVVRHPRPWTHTLQAAVAVAALLAVLHPLLTSGVFDLATVGEYLFAPTILKAVQATLALATLSTALALVLGTGIALLRISPNPVLRTAAAGYVFVFRGTPMLVQLLIWFYAVPRAIGHIGLYVPGTDIVLIPYQPASNIFTPFVAGLFALTLAEAGYMAEVVRSGIQGVDAGQRDAARALGMPSSKIMQQIVLVQAFRIVLPALGNQYILMIKNTSLAYAIGYAEILLAVSRIYYTNFKYLELLLVAAFWYLLLTAVITLAQHLLERKYPAL
ncbi:amino acid ABC transporter permease [Actinoplanes sp. NPDC051861]|uniref:amino acid ABC transporter permease n=1 Tax=Actinoplanes sp. NPDC051861 TaxID=3155170 RepID=UPI0034332E64